MTETFAQFDKALDQVNQASEKDEFPFSQKIEKGV